MSGGVIISTWGDTDGGWPSPSERATMERRTANKTPRWFPIDYSLSSTIMSGGPQNTGDQEVAEAARGQGSLVTASKPPSSSSTSST